MAKWNFKDQFHGVDHDDAGFTDIIQTLRLPEFLIRK